MRTRIPLFAAALVLGLVATPRVGVAEEPAPAGGHDEHAAHHATPAAALAIPAPVQEEHQAIHATLVQATRAPGRVGVAARRLAEVLHPHFVREEQIALPPLGLLRPLAAGENPAGMAEAAEMSATLRQEMPKMLEEHGAIRAAVADLAAAARADKAARFERLAEDLALHARTEEEVLYPATLLVGELVATRLQAKSK